MAAETDMESAVWLAADIRFEWDETKRDTNIVKHGIDFRDAALWLIQDDHVRYKAVRNGEERYIGLVPFEGRIYAIVYQDRGNTLRIISARRAQKREEREYRQFFRQGPEKR